MFGTIGIDNPHAAWEKVKELKALGDYIAVLITRRDLTNTIQREKDAMRQLIDDTPGGFCRMAIHPDAHPTLITMNVGFCRMLGMTDNEVRTEYGDDMFRCLTAEDIQTATENSKDAHFDGGQFSTKCRLRRKDGSLIWVMVFGRFVNDEAGNVYLNSYFTDITEQKKAEEQQKELLDNLPQGAALYEYDGSKISVIHINQRYWELVGRAQTDYSKSSVVEVIIPDDRRILDQEIKASIRQNRNLSVIVRIMCGDHTYKPFRITAKHTQTESGKHLFYASYSPVSEQTLSVQEMIPIAISTMMSSSSDISYVKDKDLRYLCCSQSLVDMLGFESDRDIIGKSAHELFDMKYADKFDADDSAVIVFGKPVVDATEYIPGKNGELYLAKTSKYPLLDAFGNAVGVYCQSIDITSQYEKESQLELLTSSIPGGLAAYSIDENDFKTIYFNDGYYTYSGYTREEYIAMTEKEPLALMVEEDRETLRKMIAGIAQNKKDGLSGECTYRCRTKNGGIRWMNLKAILSQVGENHFVLNVVQLDVTEQKKAESRQKELLDNLPCGAALYEFNGQSLSAIHINKQYEIMTGRSINSSNTALSPIEYVHPDDRKAVLDELRNAVAENRNGNIDIRVLFGESEYRTFHVDARITKQGSSDYLLYVTYTRVLEQ